MSTTSPSYHRRVGGSAAGPQMDWIVVLAVEPLAQAAEAWAVRLHLLCRPGVHWAEVVRPQGILRAAYDPAMTSPQALLAALDGCPGVRSARLVLVARPANLAELRPRGARAFHS